MSTIRTLESCARSSCCRGYPRKLIGCLIRVIYVWKTNSVIWDTLQSARADKVLEIVHSDVNLLTPKGFNGEIGFVTFIDDFSRLARIYCIKSKSEVVDKFMNYVNIKSNFMNCNVKILQCDRGTEYLNKVFDMFCSSCGITVKPSPPYVHELNGTAKRYNRTVMNRAWCLLTEAKIEKRYWLECVKTAAYLGNRSLANTVEQKI